jgi:hypothetical protein
MTNKKKPEYVAQGKPVSDLPAGYKRDEALAQNKDRLQEAAEKQGDQISIDPKNMEVDREIRYALEQDLLEVPNADPNYEYMWCQDQWPSNSKTLLLRKKLAEHVIINGRREPAWQIVKGKEFKEAQDIMDVLGCRRIGDCILLRCRKDVYEVLQKEDRRKRDLRQLAPSENFMALGEKAKHLGVRATTTTGQYDRAMATQLASEKFHDMVRNGTVPGAEMPKQ